MPQAGSRGKLTVVASVLIAVGTMVALAGVYLANDYRASQRSSENQLVNLANSGSAYVQQLLATIDLALRAVDEHASVDDVAIGKDPVDLHDILRRVQNASPGLQGLGLIDASGKVVGSAQSLAPKPFDLSDRDYFKYHRSNPDENMFVGRPVVSRPDDVVSIPVSRRVSNLTGGFQGVLAARLDTKQLAHVFAASGADVMALFRPDGVLLARHPSLNLPEAAALPPNSDLLRNAATASQGTFASTSPLDQRTRTIAYKVIGTAPALILAASFDQEHLRVQWLQRIAPFLIVMLGVLSLMLALGWVSYRQSEVYTRLSTAQADARRSAEEAARLAENARAEAVNAQQRKTTFLAHMSHEIRTPLNAIIGFSEVIEKRVMGERLDRYSEYAGDIHFSAQHLLSVINEVLDLSKVEAGKWRLQEDHFGAGDFVESVVRLARGRALQANIELFVRMPSPALVLYADERILRQAAINLVVNAIKYAGVDRKVDVECSQMKEGTVCFTVVDRGQGMTKEQAELALRPFEASFDRARVVEGTGLGLPLARGFVELHGGTLQLQTAPGAGTRVQILLPATRASLAAAPK